VVDDNATCRQILAATLQQWGIKAAVAESGPAALALIAQAKGCGNPFRCVLVDARMPDMDGFLLAQRLARLDDPADGNEVKGKAPSENRGAGAGLLAQPGIIMMLTTTYQRDDAVRCRELGITTQLVKPFQPRELLAALLAALRIPHAEAERPALAEVAPLCGLPARLDSARRPAPRRATAVPRRARVPSGDAGEGQRKLRVLVVEDSAVNRQLIVRLLEKRGHTSEVAANGREAMAILERAGLGSFDLVLMDVQMPEMDGFEATAAIREREKACGIHLPIIALTAYALQGDLERCLAAGMDGYLPKPVRAGELFSAVEGLSELTTEGGAGAREDPGGQEGRAE
jgi:CheY-like chemotaxis protein